VTYRAEGHLKSRTEAFIGTDIARSIAPAASPAAWAKDVRWPLGLGQHLEQ
jgi:hypothetical protein